MAGDHVNELHQLYFAGRHGFLVNSNDGFYQRGKSYGMETKLFVAAKYLDHKERLGGLRPVLTKVAAECHVGWDFVAKIERELEENDRVLTPEEIYLARDNPIGPGSMSMSREDFFVLYMLYRQQPTRSLRLGPRSLLLALLSLRLRLWGRLLRSLPPVLLRLRLQLGLRRLLISLPLLPLRLLLR